MTKDRNGYLWFATENGVVKYNGYNTMVFNIDDGLPANDVWKLFEDSRGRIWLHSHAYEIGYVENDRYVTALRSDNHNIHPDYITTANDCVLFLYKNANDINLVIYKDTLVANVSLTDLCPFPLRTAFIGSDGSLYLFKIGGTLYRYNIFANKIEHTCRFNTDPYPYFTHVHFTQSQIPYTFYGFVFKGNTMYKMTTHDCSILAFPSANIQITENESFYVWYPYNGKMFLITDGGIYEYSPELKLLTTRAYKNKIGDLQVSRYYRYNNYEWFTTVSSGVFISSLQPNIFSHINYPLNRDLTYIGSTKKNGGLWWNKNIGELVEISHKKTTSRFMPKHYGDVTAFAEDENNTLMVTTAGIYNVNTSYTNAWNIKNLNTVIFNHPYGAEKETVRILRGNDSMKEIVFSGTRKIVSFSNDTFFSNTPYVAKSYIFSKDSVSVNNVDLNRFSDILVDKKSNLIWYYNNKKILAYNPRRNIYYHVSDQFLKLAKVNNIHRLELDGHGQLYVHDNDKIIVFDIEKGRYRVLKPPVNLSEAQMRVKGDTIVMAGRFGIIFGISHGALKFDKFKLLPNDNFRYYNRLSDMVINDYYLTLNTERGILQTTLQDLWNVSTAIDPAAPGFFKVVINVASNNIVGNYDTVSVEQGPKMQQLKLDAINLSGNGKLEYQYRISGDDHDTDWQKSASGEIFLGELLPGIHYRFQYSAADELWKSPERTIYLYIQPHWYQTTAWKQIFWISGIVFAILLIAFTVFLTRYFVARSNVKKQSLVDMELRALYAQINPHFIFNTLGTALFFISKKRIDDAYVHVSKFSKLLRSYLSSSRKRYIILADEIEMLRNYIELQQIRFEEKFDYSIEVDNKVPAESMQIPTLLLQPLVENAINHGLFHRSAGGLLIIKFMQGRDNSELICIIDDNGVGRQKAKEIKRESVIQYESYGTQLTKELIEIFRKYEDMNIYLVYTDKVGEETGTIVTLTIKNLKYVA